MAAEDFYGDDGPDTDDPSGEMDESPAREDSTPKDEQSDVTETAVSKGFFGGHDCKVGDIKKVRITGVHGDERTIAYVPDDSKDDSDAGDDGDEPAIPAGMGESAGMYD